MQLNANFQTDFFVCSYIFSDCYACKQAAALNSTELERVFALPLILVLPVDTSATLVITDTQQLQSVFF